MHVLVTGGAGFIGSNLIEYHLHKGDQVLGVDDLSTGSLNNIEMFQKNPQFRFEQADILTWNGLENAVAWADRIYHMAAVVGVYRVLEDPIKVLAINIAGCERLLRAVASSKWQPRVIIASSSEVYGPATLSPLKEDMILTIESGAKNRWNYAVSKLADEAFGLSYSRKLKLPITIIRLFNTIGPRQTGRYGMVVPRFVQQAVSGDPITVFGDGSQTRSFCDVRDTVVALDLLANNTDSIGEIVNVGNDHEVSIKTLAELVKHIAKSNSPIKFMSYQEAYGEDFEEIQRRRPDLSKLVRYTGFKHQWNLEHTITDLVNRAHAK